MAGRGKYQKQVADLVASAEAENLKIEDILPEDILGHFQELGELKVARELIKDHQYREKELQAANETLEKKLKEKRKEIEDVPEETKALRVDLQQAQRQIELHKALLKDAQERSERYQRQLKEIVDKRQADDLNIAKIERLQTEVDEQQAFITKLVEENRAIEATYTKQRVVDVKTTQQMEKELAKCQEDLATMRAQFRKAYRDTTLADVGFNDTATITSGTTVTWVEVGESAKSDIWSTASGKSITSITSDESIAIIAELEDKAINLEEQNLNLEQTIELVSRSHDQIQDLETRKARMSAAAVSEIKPLNRFYTAVLQILRLYAEIFNMSSTGTPDFSTIDTVFDSAYSALGDYYTVNEIMRADVEETNLDDADQIALRKELGALAQCAATSQLSLEALRGGFLDFVGRIYCEPEIQSCVDGSSRKVDKSQGFWSMRKFSTRLSGR